MLPVRMWMIVTKENPPATVPTKILETYEKEMAENP